MLAVRSQNISDLTCIDNNLFFYINKIELYYIRICLIIFSWNITVYRYSGKHLRGPNGILCRCMRRCLWTSDRRWSWLERVCREASGEPREILFALTSLPFFRGSSSLNRWTNSRITHFGTEYTSMFTNYIITAHIFSILPNELIFDIFEHKTFLDYLTRFYAI